MTNTVPLLLIDVDGVLNPRASTRLLQRALRARGFQVMDGWKHTFKLPPNSNWRPLSQLFLNQSHAQMLARFSAIEDVELVWCSLWTSNCNSIISKALGLPRLPFVDFFAEEYRSLGSKVWKWDAVADFAAGRPIAWLDDSFEDARHRRSLSRFDASRRNLPTLLQPVDPFVGLQASDLAVVRGWLRTVELAW